MPSLTKELQHLRAQLKERSPRIVQSAYLLDLEFSPVSEGRFTVKATWEKPTWGRMTIIYDRRVFARLDTTGVLLKKSVCKMTEDIIKDILRERGIPV
jgi:hypothetical protein